MSSQIPCHLKIISRFAAENYIQYYCCDFLVLVTVVRFCVHFVSCLLHCNAANNASYETQHSVVVGLSHPPASQLQH